jgi:hypothetical protein
MKTTLHLEKSHGSYWIMERYRGRLLRGRMISKAKVKKLMKAIKDWRKG